MLPAVIIFPIIFSTLLFMLIIKWHSNSRGRSKSSSPPSPPKLPIIGNLHQLGTHPHHALHSLAERYGPLMLLHLGRLPVLVISSAGAASEIMKTHDRIFASRPQKKMFDILLYGSKDVATAPYGQHWRQARSVCVLHLLSVKMVRSLGAVREEETAVLMEKIRHASSSSLAVNLTELFYSVTNDIICRATMGAKYSGERGREFKELVVEFTELLGTFLVGEHVPWLDWLTRMSGVYARANRVATQFDEFLGKVVEEHINRQKGDVGSDDDTQGHHHRDFVDVLLWIQRTNAAGFPIDKTIIKAIILDMFSGGTDSTSTALAWAMAELLMHPIAMKKLQDEVRNVAGDRKHITEEDLVHMHYLKAVIKETLRLHPPFPLLVPRQSTQDVKLSGYHIVAGTEVMVNAWAIARDPTYWDQPKDFIPERFMNSSINVKENDFLFVPFGGGRRGCPGSTFAISLSELVLANLIHQFDWTLPAGEETLAMIEAVGVSMHRKDPLVVVAAPRM